MAKQYCLHTGIGGLLDISERTLLMPQKYTVFAACVVSHMELSSACLGSSKSDIYSKLMAKENQPTDQSLL